MANVGWLIGNCRITDGLCGCLLLNYEIISVPLKRDELNN